MDRKRDIRNRFPGNRAVSLAVAGSVTVRAWRSPFSHRRDPLTSIFCSTNEHRLASPRRRAAPRRSLASMQCVTSLITDLFSNQRGVEQHILFAHSRSRETFSRKRRSGTFYVFEHFRTNSPGPRASALKQSNRSTAIEYFHHPRLALTKQQYLPGTATSAVNNWTSSFTQNSSELPSERENRKLKVFRVQLIQRE